MASVDQVVARTSSKGFGEFDETFDELDPEIRQGDVVQLIHPAEEGPESEWASHLGVIVTANCDLVYGKHAGLLSYVPIVPIAVYLRLLMLPRILASVLADAERSVHEALPEGPGVPTADRVMELVSLGESTSGLFADVDDGENADVAVECFRMAFEAARSYDTRDSFEEAIRKVDELFAGLRKVRGKPAQPVGAQLGKELRSRLVKSLPGDCMFFAQPTQGHPSGHVAYLRLIREVREDRIATSAVSERKLGDAIAARRVGRLQLLYLHRLTQQMAQVFTEIGLPADYEQSRDGTLSANMESWIQSISISSEET